jgi:phospholipid/cholesterol/gamma-HCH transport system permease protein
MLGLAALGGQLAFAARAVASTPFALRRHRREIGRLIGEIAWGRGAVAVAGGTVAAIGLFSFLTGTETGLRGYAAFNQVGVSAFTGFLGAYLNTRELAPLVAGLALSVTAGAGFTAQIGAARAGGEIDALEAMGTAALPFLVTTRLIAGIAMMVPLYLVGLLSSYLASRTIATALSGQAAGAFDHYFHLFLPPQDVLWSFLKALLFAVIVVIVHCYQGYHAVPDLAGAGLAVGRAVRTAMVAMAVGGFLFSLAIWGARTSVQVAG